jgi:CheY-like chemotaxis protein
MTTTATTKPNILMVDDEPDFQTIVHDWLEPSYEHCALKDGDELIGALHAGAPDLVILDLNLPGADGFELCRRVRETPGMRDVPILFLTGSRQPRDYRDNFAAGGTGWLLKPVGRRQLLHAVEELIARETTPPVDDGGGD